MKKVTIFGVTMLLLVALMSIMPLVKATVYYWDGIRFVSEKDAKGGWVKYPHPDRDYYNISPYILKGINGINLHHLQIDQTKSATIIASACLLCAFLGAYIGGKVGALVTAALETTITIVSEAFFFDEYHCIWVWVARTFIDWIQQNEEALLLLSLTNWQMALNQVLEHLASGGYLRIGTITFLDAIGKGNPTPEYPPATPSKPSGPTVGYERTWYSYYTSTTDPDGDNVRYEFDWGDGKTTWTGWYASGATAKASHSWAYAGTYYVKVRAQDSRGYYSGWSQSLQVVMKVGCPTLFVWNGSEYVEEGVLNIHADSDVTVQHRIEGTLVPDGYFYMLSLRELDEFTSHIDYVKLYAVNTNGEWYNCYLVKAVHSELGYVTAPLLFDDNRRVNLTPQQTIDLTFLPPQTNEIAYFIFEINGYNAKIE